MKDIIRRVVAEHAGLPGGIDNLPDDADLYSAGMKSFASVQLMLALEDAFDIEFPEHLLARSTFRSITAIHQAVSQLTSSAVAA